MKAKTVYVDEITKAEFDSERAAKESEAKHREIKAMFDFVKITKSRNNCDFDNGEYCVRHDAKYYDRFRTTLIAAIRKYEPWIAKEFDKKCGLEAGMKPCGIIGRYIGDGADDMIIQMYGIWANICPTCYREWGQGYYSLHCNHTDTRCESGL
jgi:hypothetical protein